MLDNPVSHFEVPPQIHIENAEFQLHGNDTDAGQQPIEVDTAIQMPARLPSKVKSFSYL